MKNFIKRIDKLPINEESKEGYKWLLVNFDVIQYLAKMSNTVGKFRTQCMREIGFAPALMFSFKGCYKNKLTFIQTLELGLKR